MQKTLRTQPQKILFILVFMHFFYTFRQNIVQLHYLKDKKHVDICIGILIFQKNCTLWSKSVYIHQKYILFL